MIQIVLLTGFLGAGKTTLMQNLLESFSAYKIGIIVNEFGSVSIDGALVRQDGIQMTELSNGSIFCACIKDKFVDGLIQMSSLELEYLFIEASGLADPSNMEEILEGISHKTKNALLYKGAICIVDAETFEDLYDLLPAVHNQIEYSSAILLNKADLSTSQQLAEATIKINQVNPLGAVYITSFCRADYQEIVENLRKPGTSSRESGNTPESRPKTFVLTQKATLPLEGLRQFLEEVAGEGTYRIKGFATTDQGRKSISGVGKHLEVMDWEDPGEDHIVVISSVGIRLISQITQSSDRHLKGLLGL